MASKHECKLRTALSTLAAAALLAVTVAGSPAVFAQTATLQPPASGLKTAPRAGQAVGNTPATTLAAPAAVPMGQTGIAPVNSMANVRVSKTPAVTKIYQVKAQVVPGAVLSAQQKLATVMAALDELARQAKEQQDKETEEKIAQMKKTLSIGNSATLSLMSPKSPIGNSTLSLSMTKSVDFEANKVQFNPSTLKQYGNVIGWPAAYCDFTAPEDGFYMVAFAVEVVPVGTTTTVTAGINYLGPWTPQNESKSALTKGGSVVAVIQELHKGTSASAKITSDDYFIFKACEISRIK